MNGRRAASSLLGLVLFTAASGCAISYGDAPGSTDSGFEKVDTADAGYDDSGGLDDDSGAANGGDGADDTSGSDEDPATGLTDDCGADVEDDCDDLGSAPRAGAADQREGAGPFLAPRPPAVVFAAVRFGSTCP